MVSPCSELPGLSAAAQAAPGRAAAHLRMHGMLVQTAPPCSTVLALLCVPPPRPAAVDVKSKLLNTSGSVQIRLVGTSFNVTTELTADSQNIVVSMPPALAVAGRHAAGRQAGGQGGRGVACLSSHGWAPHSPQTQQA